MGGISQPGTSATVNIPAKIVTANTYQLLATDFGTKVSFTSATGCVITLLDPASANTPTNFHCWLQNSTGSTCTVNRKLADTIFGPGNATTGTTSVDMTSPNSGYHIETNGVNWYAISGISSASGNGGAFAYTTTATAAGTTTLTSASTFIQRFTGTLAQTVVLPVTSTLSLGQQFQIINDSTGTLTIKSSGANNIILPVGTTTTLLTCVNLAVTTAAGWTTQSTTFSTQRITATGAFTYTTPLGAKRIRIRMKGSGGSTQGSSTDATGGAAGAGTATSFNSITAVNGSNSGQSAGGKPSGGSGGTGGAGATVIRLAGAMGGPQPISYATATNVYILGGIGAGTGGALTRDPTAYGNANGVAGVANTGGGASGAGLTTSLAFAGASGGWTSGGGGEGEYVEFDIFSPAATYSGVVGAAGAGGTAGTGGAPGAQGGSGFVEVDEYY